MAIKKKAPTQKILKLAKEYAGFSGKGKVRVTKQTIDWPDAMTFVGMAKDILYDSDKWDGKMRAYIHKFKKHGKIYLSEKKNMIIITGVNLTMHPEGIKG